MLLEIAPSDQLAFKNRLTEMHFLRGRVFKDRLEWAVTLKNGQEFDEYDGEGPTYLLYIGSDGVMKGSIRLLPTTGTNMLRDTFSQLLDGKKAPQSPVIWESSRFCLDKNLNDEMGDNRLSRGCVELFAGMIEFGIARGLSSIVTVTDVLIERILKRAGWEVSRIGSVHPIGNSKAVALDMPCTMENLQRIRAKSGFYEPVLWRLPTSYQPQPHTQAETFGEAQNIHASLTFLRRQAEELGLNDLAHKLSTAQQSITNTING